MIKTIRGDKTILSSIDKIFGGEIAGLQDNIHGGEKFKLVICPQNEDRTHVQVVFTAPSERVSTEVAASMTFEDDYFEIESNLPVGFTNLKGVQDRLAQLKGFTGFSARKIQRLFSWSLKAV